MEEPAEDRCGNRVGIHPVLAAADLLLDLDEAHLAFPFVYRLLVTDQCCINIRHCGGPSRREVHAVDI
ncbi:MAG: hypothetical protein ACLP50_06535 [Solirubrobacteraceae bacterium]